MMRIAMVVFLCLITLDVGAWAQAKRPPLPGEKQLPDQSKVEDAHQAQMDRERLRRLNLQRWENLKKDTDELLKLATELQQQVAAGNENTLSVTVIRKAEQIEKLAKSVREKMKGQ